MPDDSKIGLPDDDWPREPDAWDEADRAYRAKWSDAPGDETPDTPSSYEPTRATPRAVTDSYRGGMQAAGPYLGLGAQIAASMVIFAGGGYLLDRWLGTSPWGILIGAMLGMAGILALIVRTSREADQEARRRRKR